jgi:2-methylcitrate dehydratase PrpD
MGETPKWPALIDGLGDTWELSKNAYKPYPGGVVIHPVIDCVLDLRAKILRTENLRAKTPLAPDAISRIVVHGHPLLSERADRPNVTTGREAQVSVQHSVAAAHLFGKAGLEQYTDACVRDPAVMELRRKVEVRQDPNIPVEAASLELWTKDGQHHRIAVDAARGSSKRPLSDRELEDKFMTLVAPSRLDGGGQRLLEALWALDQSEDASKLLALTVPAA